MADCLVQEFNKDIPLNSESDHMLVDGGPFNNGFVDLESVGVYTDFQQPPTIQIAVTEAEGGSVAVFLTTDKAKELAMSILDAVDQYEELGHG